MNSPLPFLGHEDIARRLALDLTHSRLAHALLLTGPEGIGKKKLSLDLAQKILCLSKEPGCKSCASCRKSDIHKHPDLIVIEAEDEKIKIDSIRELKKLLSFAPFIGNARVVLIDDAHHLNTAAANALLKTLEEPSLDTYFILVTHALGWIPRTIISRCQRIPMAPLSTAHVEEILNIQEIPCSQRAIQWAQGSVKMAIHLHDIAPQVPSIEQLSQAKQFSFNHALELAHTVSQNQQVSALLQALLCQAHQSLIEKNLARPTRFEILHFVDNIIETRRVLRQNANPKIQLARLLMHFQEGLQTRL